MKCYMSLYVNISYQNGLKKVNQLYMDTDNYYSLIERGDIYKDTSGDVEKWFETSYYGER